MASTPRVRGQDTQSNINTLCSTYQKEKLLALSFSFLSCAKTAHIGGKLGGIDAKMSANGVKHTRRVIHSAEKPFNVYCSGLAEVWKPEATLVSLANCLPQGSGRRCFVPLSTHLILLWCLVVDLGEQPGLTPSLYIDSS